MIDTLFNLNSCNEKIFIYCRNEIVHEVSDEFLYLTGYNYEKIIGKSLKELNELLKCTYQYSHIDIKDRYSVYLFNNENTPKLVNITVQRLNRKNEKIYFFQEVPNQFLSGILSTCVDVDDNHKESIAIYSYPECITLKVNKNYIKDSYFLTDKGYDLMGNICNFSSYLLDSIEGKLSNYESEVEILDKEGNTTYWNISLMLISEDGKGKYIRASYYNETEKVITRKHLEKQTKEKKVILDNMSQALKSQDEIFVNTSHELKTPLNLIFSASQLLNIYSKADNIEAKKEQIIKNNSIITQNCYRIIKLISNILDISKIEEGFCELDLDNNNIVRTIESIVKSVSEYTEDLELQIVFESEIEEKNIGFDLYKIERIMLNLISNAIKYSNSNGTILVKLTEQDDFIEISVIDDGIGINEENFDVIFEKFRQVNKSLNRKVEGTGVGLSLVKSLVELHSGSISVESALGQGSTFKFTIPSKTVDKPKKSEYDYCQDNRVEMIKFELSDIYS